MTVLQQLNFDHPPTMMFSLLVYKHIITIKSQISYYIPVVYMFLSTSSVNYNIVYIEQRGIYQNYVSAEFLKEFKI